jgi:hypothetical protein
MLTRLVLVVVLTAGCAATAPPPPTETMTPREVREIVCGNDTKVGGRSINIEIDSFPCTAVKTRHAIEDTKGRGFWGGPVTRFFLRTRLVARGMFSTVFGLVGLG